MDSPEVRDLEDQAAGAAGAAWDVWAATARIAGARAAAAEDTTAMARSRARRAAVDIDVDNGYLTNVVESSALAGKHAAEATVPDGTQAAIRAAQGPRFRQVVAGLEALPRQLAGDLQARLADLEDPDDMAAAISQAGQAFRSRAVSGARFAVHTAASEAQMHAGQQYGEQTGQNMVMVWVNERDACVHCLAYAGQTVPADGSGSFPPGRSFDPRGGLTPYASTLPYPPLHPHCRCGLELWSPDWGDDLPRALEREAERSILNGYALPSESEQARRRAAEALLERGPRRVQVQAPQLRAGRRLRSSDQFARALPDLRQLDAARPIINPLLPAGRSDIGEADAGTRATASAATTRKAAVRRGRRRASAERRILDDVQASSELGDMDPAVAARYIENAQDVRRRIRAEAADFLAEAEAELDRLDARRIGNPPPVIRSKDPVTGAIRSRRENAGAEWDWWDGLDDATRRRLQRNGHAGSNRSRGSSAISSNSPDNVAEAMRSAGLVSAGASDEEALDAWLGLVDAVDDARSMAAGKAPKGATALERIAPDMALELGAGGLEVADVWDVSEPTQAVRLARADLELRLEYDDTILQRRTDRPRPWEMDAGEYADELAAVDRSYREHVIPRLEAGPDPATGLDEVLFTAEEFHAMQRFEELVPEGLTDGDTDRQTINAAEMHGRLRWVAGIAPDEE